MNLNVQIEVRHYLKKLEHDNAQYRVWKKNVVRTLGSIYGKDSEYVSQFNEISFSLGIFIVDTPDSDFQNAYLEGLKEAELLLNSYLKEIYDSWGHESESPSDDSKPTKSPKDIFIVHGHDIGAREEVSRFVEKLKLNPIILKDKANQGRTTIEKFVQESSSSSFAIVLFTPDDIGFPKDKSDQAKPRARQNVIFELGYFISNLGRKNVCVLYKEGVEILTDFVGVLYIPYDDKGAWKLDLVKEMQAAGISFDLSDVV